MGRSDKNLTVAKGFYHVIMGIDLECANNVSPLIRDRAHQNLGCSTLTEGLQGCDSPAVGE